MELRLAAVLFGVALFSTLGCEKEARVNLENRDGALFNPDTPAVVDPRHHQHLSEPYGVGICDLAQLATHILKINVISVADHTDTSKLFAGYGFAAKGETSLVLADVLEQQKGPPIEKVKILVPGRNVPPTMDPFFYSGEVAYVFLVSHPNVKDLFVVVYGWEGKFWIDPAMGVTNDQLTFGLKGGGEVSFLKAVVNTLSGTNTCDKPRPDPVAQPTSVDPPAAVTQHGMSIDTTP